MTPPSILAAFFETDFLTKERLSQLTNFFGSLESAWNSSSIEDLMMAGIPERSAQLFWEKKAKIHPEKSLEKLQKCGAQLLFWEDEDYPELLRRIASPPIFLAVRGEVSALSHLSLAVVGSRRISTPGRQIVGNLVPPLVRSGLAIVSGLAKGVDAAAHRETLNTGGITIGVLGNGIDHIYPSDHHGLAEEILKNNGAIISEFAPGVSPAPYHFPRRNRIVSGLSLGTLIVEGKEKSGSLITAHCALEQNRDVFAVPHFPTSILGGAPNRLIQKGEAKLVMSAEDILCELPLEQLHTEKKVQQALPTKPIEKEVFALLSSESQFFDDLVRKSTLSSAQFSATLTILEMKGFIISLGSNQWAQKI